ncbi:hypothetical protein PLIIFM63780_003082 [Purpureocillium lilacinum]|nr:hypothetical protein PLIIFM63780_003082 [Purpureocillium lilacinum]
MARPEDAYQWALIIGRRSYMSVGDMSLCYQVTQTPKELDPKRPLIMGWTFEELSLTSKDPVPLVRIVVGKLNKHKLMRLRKIFQSIPVFRPNKANWNSAHWVEYALRTAVRDKRVLGDCVCRWTEIRGTAMNYLAWKKSLRRYEATGPNDRFPPTYDKLDECELIP